MRQFESKEVCKSLCFHSKSECAGGAKASGVRRCVRDGCGAGSARAATNSGHSFSFKILCA